MKEYPEITYNNFYLFMGLGSLMGNQTTFVGKLSPTAR
jgi:hypothetical protein